jgi:hypothetical protein
MWPGSFQVFRKGPQIVNQWGAHSGHEGVFGQAGNSLIFPDANPSGDPGDYGGHRGSGNTHGADQFIEGGPADERDELIVETNGVFGYVYVDHTRAYASPRTHGTPKPRISEATRQIVYLKPQSAADPVILVILDRATTLSPNFEKRWIMHTSGAPTLQPDGRVCATNTAFGANGRTCVTSLAPSTTARTLTGNWTPYGYLKDIVTTAAMLPWVPNYTVDLRPTTDSRSDVFLTVVEVSDAGAMSTPVTYLGGTSVRVGTRTITFSGKGVSVL